MNSSGPAKIEKCVASRDSFFVIYRGHEEPNETMKIFKSVLAVSIYESPPIDQQKCVSSDHTK